MVLLPMTSASAIAAEVRAGVPVVIKDNVDVTGEPTRHGSLAYDDVAATRP